MKIDTTTLGSLQAKTEVMNAKQISSYVNENFLLKTGGQISGSISIQKNDVTNNAPGAIADGTGSIAVGAEYYTKNALSIISITDANNMTKDAFDANTEYMLSNDGNLFSETLDSKEFEAGAYVKRNIDTNMLWKTVGSTPDAIEMTIDQLNQIESYSDMNAVYKLVDSGELSSFLYARKGMTIAFDGDKKSVMRSRALAYGDGSSAFGSAIAFGTNTFSQGGAQAYGHHSHAEGGTGTKAIEKYSHAEGADCITYAQCSHAEGSQCKAFGEASHTEGYYAESYGMYSHAEGATCKAVGNASHAEGKYTLANGKYSHAEGLSTIAAGNQSHSDGILATAEDDSSYVWSGNDLSVYRSHGIGTFSINPKSIDTVNDVTTYGHSSAGGMYLGEDTLDEIIDRKISLNQNVEKSSKQIFDCRNIKFIRGFFADNKIMLSQSGVEHRILIVPINDIPAGTEYITIHRNAVNTSRFQIAISENEAIRENTEVLNLSTHTDDLTATVNITPNTKYLLILCWLNTESGTAHDTENAFQELTKNLMVEFGNKFTEYQPFVYQRGIIESYTRIENLSSEIDNKLTDYVKTTDFAKNLTQTTPSETSKQLFDKSNYVMMNGYFSGTNFIESANKAHRTLVIKVPEHDASISQIHMHRNAIETQRFDAVIVENDVVKFGVPIKNAVQGKDVTDLTIDLTPSAKYVLLLCWVNTGTSPYLDTEEMFTTLVENLMVEFGNQFTGYSEYNTVYLKPLKNLSLDFSSENLIDIVKKMATTLGADIKN